MRITSTLFSDALLTSTMCAEEAEPRTSSVANAAMIDVSAPQVTKQVVLKFQPQERGYRGIENVLALANGSGSVSDFNTTTYGRISFRNVEPLPKEDKLVADSRLQQRLEMLCEKLRSKY